MEPRLVEGRDGCAGGLEDVSRDLIADGLRSLYNANILPIFLWTDTGQFVTANDAFLRMIDVRRPDLESGRVRWDSLASREDLAIGARAIEELRRNGVTAPFEKTYLLADGRRLPVILGISFLAGREDLGIGYVIDLSTRRRVERALGETEQRFRLALEHSPVILFTLDHQLRYTWIHHPSLGNAVEFIIGKTDRQLTVQKTADILLDFKRHVLDSGQGERREIVIDLIGKRRIYDLTLEPIRDSKGQVTGLAGAGIDISERREAEEALRESERRERARADEIAALMELVPASVWIAHDADCRKISGSRASYEILRMPYGLNASITAPEEERPIHFKVCRNGMELKPEELPVQMAARGELVRDSEHDVVFDDGTVISLCGNAIPLFDENGKPRGAVSAFLDVTRLKAAEAALRQADHRKNEFLAMLSHELRNPLASISNAVRLLPSGPGIEPDAEWARDVIERQVGHLSRMIDDLLDVSRFASGKIQIRRDRVELSGILRRAVDASRSLIEGRKHQLTLKIPGPLPELDADATRLEQVFVNLISNAAKYTDEGGAITVSAEAETDGKGVRVTVADTGVGISEEMLTKVFELFTQADGSIDRSQGGLGIGLALVRNLVHMHGGEVSVQSEGLGHGSTFQVWLPALPPVVHETPAAPSPGRRVGATVRNAPARPLSILIVEDSIDAARGMVRLLQRSGHEPVAVHDGVAALEHYEANAYDVVLLDIGLPGMDGLEIARRIRSHARESRPLLLAISGYGQQEDRQRSVDAGFDDHLVKPLLIDALLQRLNEFAAASRGI